MSHNAENTHEDGISTTVGIAIHEAYPEIPHDNWMSDKRFSPIDREQHINDVLRFALARRLVLDNVLWFRDFPKPGVLFQDLSNVLGCPDLLKLLNFAMAYHIKVLGWAEKAKFAAGLDARGFIYGAMAASE